MLTSAAQTSLDMLLAARTVVKPEMTSDSGMETRGTTAHRIDGVAQSSICGRK